MPQIQCPNCHKDIADTCEKCSYCGYQIKSIIIDDVDDNRANYFLIGSRIFFVALILAILTVIIMSIRNSTKESIERSRMKSIEYENLESQKHNIENPDSLLSVAKIFYKEGQLNFAAMNLTKIIDNCKNTNAAIEASKFRVIVLKAIDSVQTIRKRQVKLEYEKLNKKRAEEERKRHTELEELYRRNVILYFRNIYGKPDSESDFSYSSYMSKTLTWNCADGRYRSITFIYNNGTWSKESEFASECIN
jgi:hypothetical protein